LQSGSVILLKRADERQTSVTAIRMQNECLAMTQNKIWIKGI